MAYSRTWDETRPAGNVIAANTIDTEIQYVRNDVSDRFKDIFGIVNFALDPIVPTTVRLNRTAASTILGGTTSLSLRNAADTQDNLIITNAGVATFIGTVNAPTFVGALTGNVTGNVTGTASNATLAAAATKLATARNLWGLPFDGTAALSGGLTIVGNSAITGNIAVAGQYSASLYTIASSSTPNADWNNSNVQKITLTSNATFTFTNPVAGGRYVLILLQDVVGSRTVTWPASVRWIGGAAPILTTTVSRNDIVAFIYDGASYIGSVGLNA